MMSRVSNVLRWLSDTASSSADLIAISDGETHYSYSDYEKLTNGAGNDLVNLGVLPGDRVGILIGKSASYYLAVYATLKAGAGFVALSQVDPPEILKSKIKSAGIKMIIIDQDTPSENILGTPVSLYNIQQIARSNTGPSCIRYGHSLAYICYTSGSTGNPKPVAISDAALECFFDSIQKRIHTNSTDRIANTAPFFFDIANYDIFSAILSGAVVIPVPPQVQWLPRSLYQCLRDRGITRMIMPPNQLGPLLDMCHRSGFTLPSIRNLIFGGEVMPNEQLKLLPVVFPNATFHNAYGPSETTIFCSLYSFSTDHSDLEVPLGAPLEGSEFRVRDPKTGTFLGAGGLGELCIAGPQLFDGYWAQPDVTEKSMLHDTDSGSLFYKTGDLVEVDSAGNLYFRGRTDSMKKVNGVRVDLVEIEACLASNSNVIQVMVVLVQGKGRLDTLGAAVRLKRNSKNDLSALRQFCQERLQPSHLPRKFQSLSFFPTATTGKVDRNAITDLFHHTKDQKNRQSAISKIKKEHLPNER